MTNTIKRLQTASRPFVAWGLDGQGMVRFPAGTVYHIYTKLRRGQHAIHFEVDGKHYVHPLWR